jgi:hypothetical protein
MFLVIGVTEKVSPGSQKKHVLCLERFSAQATPFDSLNLREVKEKDPTHTHTIKRDEHLVRLCVRGSSGPARVRGHVKSCVERWRDA